MDHTLPATYENKAFLQGISLVLIGIGGIGLLLGISCWLIDWGYCGSVWVPMVASGGQELSRLLQVNFPLAMLLLGLSLRQFTTLGWIMSVMLTTALFVFFAVLVFILSGKGQLLPLLIRPGEVSIGMRPWLQACTTDILLALMNLFGLLLLNMPAIRKLYYTFPTKK